MYAKYTHNRKLLTTRSVSSALRVRIVLISLALSGAVFSFTALSSSPQSLKDPNGASGTVLTVEQLLQRVTVLERDFEQETRAMEALDVRIAQIEAQYLAVKSRIEQQLADEVTVDAPIPAVQASLSQSHVTPLSAPSAQPTTQDTGVSGGFGEHGEETGSATSAPFAHDVEGTYVVAVGLVVLVLLLILNAYRRKRAHAQRDQNDGDIGAFLDTQASDEKNKGERSYLHSLRKLIALRKVAQHPAETDESTVVIKSGQYQHRQQWSADRAGKSAANTAIADARRFVAQNKPEQAVHVLESFLARNKDSEIGWQLLFKLLFELKQNNAFRKHALRFKRLEQFPDIWEKVKIWGHALEPDETLYMTEQEKKQRFFSG